MGPDEIVLAFPFLSFPFLFSTSSIKENESHMRRARLASDYSSG